MVLYRRRRVVRKKRVMRRRPMAMRRLKRVPLVHKFKEMCPYPSTITATASSLGTGILSYQLSQLTNVTSFQAVFDLYKITGVKVKIVPRYNQASVLENNAVPSGALPLLYIAANRNPYQPAPANIQDVLNDDTCKVYRMDKPITLWLSSPKPDIQTGDEANPSSMPFQFGVGSKWQPWLTTGGGNSTINQSAIKHYGHRYVIDNQAAVDVSAQVFVTYYLQFKEQD